MDIWSQRAQGFIQVRVPLPFSLRWINSYLLADENGWLLIDPGLNTDDARQHWLRVFRELDIHPEQIHSIVLTHHHPDHYGLAGWMQQLTQAPVLMADRGYAQTQRLWGDSYRQTAETLLAIYRAHGFPEESEDVMREHLHSFVEQVSPHPVVSSLNPGETIWLADRPYQVLEAHGHAFGHLCFYQPDEKVIFCGDHVMPHISPNVSYWPGVDENPLQSFLDSLRQFRELEIHTAYPGHREPFNNWSQRIDQLLHHHEQRLNWFLDYLEQSHSAWESCRALFGDRLTVHQSRFAFSETLAHLIFLEKQGKIKNVGHTTHIYQGVSR